METVPTLAQLILAYDRGKSIGGDGYERLFRGGFVTMQGGLTHEGEKALIGAYHHQNIRLEARVADLVVVGNQLARIPATAGRDATAAQVKRRWRELVKGETP